MPAREAAVARELWHLLEPVHAVTYFAEESRAAADRIGLRGFWMGYFAFRAAPLGPVGPGVVEAVFAGFARRMVERSLPDAWGRADPASCLQARSSAAAAALRRLAPSAEEVALAVLPDLRRAIAGAPAAGRPLFSANRGLAPSPDPVEELWQAATALREHRGDGHVACLVAGGLDGCHAHVLAAACEGVPAEVLQVNRGWTDDEWQASSAELERQGLLAAGAATERGRAVRAAIEERTDALAGGAYRSVGAGGLVAVRAALRGLADAVVRSGTIPFPNPMGLPPPGSD